MSITKEDAIKAIQTLLEYIGEDYNRNSLAKTPERFLSVLENKFTGYGKNAENILTNTFNIDKDSLLEQILFKDIEFISYCEHHITRFYGKIHISYIPSEKIIGLSRISDLVEMHSKKLQLQEKMNIDIANDINNFLLPKGVAVLIEAKHECNYNNICRTHCFLGEFKMDKYLQNNFISSIS